MTKNNIYEILIKSIGLILIYQIIFIIREFGISIMMFSIQTNEEDIRGKNLFIIYYVVSILILALISYFLIFKTKSILTKINRNDQVDIELNLNINKHELFKIVLKSLGFIVTIWTFPSFIIEIIKYFNKENLELNYFFSQKENLIYESIKMALGIVIIIFSNKINELTNTEKEN